MFKDRSSDMQIHSDNYNNGNSKLDIEFSELVSATNNKNETDNQSLLSKTNDISQNTTKRNKSFDIFRGIIMITMALDHIRWGLGLGPSGTFWYPTLTLYDKFNQNLGLITYYFICTFITMICAPGFFFLMGFGMVHFYEHRHGKLQWSNIYTVTHLLKRGVILIICGSILWYLCYKTRSLDNGRWMPSDVLVPLGLDMFLISTFIFIENYTYNNDIKIFFNLCPVGIITVFIVLLFCVISTALIIPNYDEYCTNSMAEQGLCTIECYNKTLLFFWMAGTCEWMFTVFPAIPYMTYVCFGIIIGRYTFHCNKYKHMDICMRNCMYFAISLFFCFIIIRWIDGFGNFGRPWKGDDAASPWHVINFLNTSKYPPSMASILLFMSVDIFIIWFSYVCQNKFGDKTIIRWILVFGNTALFFYMLHLIMCYIVIFWIADAIKYDKTSWSTALSLLPLWFCVLLICYPFCKWYMNFKKNKPATSIWKMF